jgi:hypothetical protein
VDTALLAREIVSLNRQFLTLIVRANERDLNDLCLRMNANLPFMEQVRRLSSSQLEALAQTPRCLIQPAVDAGSIERAATIQNPGSRAMYMAAAGRVRHAAA